MDATCNNHDIGSASSRTKMCWDIFYGRVDVRISTNLWWACQVVLKNAYQKARWFPMEMQCPEGAKRDTCSHGTASRLTSTKNILHFYNQFDTPSMTEDLKFWCDFHYSMSTFSTRDKLAHAYYSLAWISRNIVAMSRISNRWYLLDGSCRRLFVLHQIVNKCYSPRHLHRWVADVLALVFRATASMSELKFDRRTGLMNIDSQLDLSRVIKYLQGISTVLRSIVCNFFIPHKIQQLAQFTQPTNHSTQTQTHIHTYTYNTQNAPIHLSCRLPGYCFGCACCSRHLWATSRNCKFWLYLAFDRNILMMI